MLCFNHCKRIFSKNKNQIDIPLWERRINKYTVSISTLYIMKVIKSRYSPSISYILAMYELDDIPKEVWFDLINNSEDINAIIMHSTRYLNTEAYESIFKPTLINLAKDYYIEQFQKENNLHSYDDAKKQIFNVCIPSIILYKN
jgi:hypothetical protein